MDKVLKLQQEQAAKFAAMKALSKKADDENRNLTADEQTQYDALKAEFKAYDQRIERAKEEAAEEKRMSEIPADQKGIRPDPGPTVEVKGDRELEKPFGSFGEQLGAIAMASKSGGVIDRRLLQLNETNAKASGGSAGVPSDGGFAIQSDFAQTIMTRGFQTGVLASRCDQVEISENADSLEEPYVDETSRETGSRWGGVQIYWAAEAAAVAAGKPKIGKLETRLEDLRGIAYATNRLLQDAKAMSQIYTQAFSEEFGYMLDEAILNGDGVGKPLGILASGALVSVPKENGQAAATILAQNIVNMRARLFVRSRATSIWLINQDCEPALHTMSIAVGTGGVPVYLPATGLAGSPFDTLYARPVIPIEQCKTLGTVGDIVYVDLFQYRLIKKGAVESASSMHVKFVEDEMAFRFKLRTNGQPKWKTSIKPANGTKNVSPFVALATRS